MNQANRCELKFVLHAIVMRASLDVKRFAESLRMRDGVSQYSTTKIKDESTLLLTNNKSPFTAV